MDGRLTLPIDAAEWAAVSDPEAPEAADASITRFGFRETAATVDVHPVLGDRTFVVRPEHDSRSPSERLALYASTRHVLWTQGIAMDRRDDSEGADVRVIDGPPDDAAAPTRLAAPRDEVKTSLAMSTFRAIGSLFGT